MMYYQYIVPNTFYELRYDVTVYDQFFTMFSWPRYSPLRFTLIQTYRLLPINLIKVAIWPFWNFWPEMKLFVHLNVGQNGNFFCCRRRATWSPPSWLGWARSTPEVLRPFFILRSRGLWCQQEGRRPSGTTSIGKAIVIRGLTTEAAPSSREQSGFWTNGFTTLIRYFYEDWTLKLDRFMGHKNMMIILKCSSFLEQST